VLIAQHNPFVKNKQTENDYKINENTDKLLCLIKQNLFHGAFALVSGFLFLG